MKDTFLLRNFSLRDRIFFSLIILSIISSVLISTVSVYQFREEARVYHQYRLERKETAINENVNYILTTSQYPTTQANIPLIFKDKIHELAAIHNVEINLYDLKGHLIMSSRGYFSVDSISTRISPVILQTLQGSQNKRLIDVQDLDNKKFRIAYTYVRDGKYKPLGILKIPYEDQTSFYENEIKKFMNKFLQVYLFMLLLSIAISYFLSNYIIQNLTELSNTILKTRLGQKNNRIKSNSGSKEILGLIEAYNYMVDELEKSYHKLAQSEREQAWREMAKQVAHEIKNPLTPMRLTLQSFVKHFDPNDPNVRQKLQEVSLILIQQIDTMSSVATAFSSFASMPAQQNENIDIINTAELALALFNEPYIEFKHPEQTITTRIDRTQLIRIITNLVKNAIQAIAPDNEDPKIVVSIFTEASFVIISIKDNGTGIDPEIAHKIFEPKFTTKSSGMGLGLGIIKNIVENYNGSITFNTYLDKGTTFIVKLPLIKTQ